MKANKTVQMSTRMSCAQIFTRPSRTKAHTRNKEEQSQRSPTRPFREMYKIVDGYDLKLGIFEK